MLLQLERCRCQYVTVIGAVQVSVCYWNWSGAGVSMLLQLERCRCHYVTVIGAVQVSVFACLSSSCNHVTDVGGLAVKFVTQNDRDFVDVILSHLTLNKHII